MGQLLSLWETLIVLGQLPVLRAAFIVLRQLPVLCAALTVPYWGTPHCVVRYYCHVYGCIIYI